MSSKHLKYEWSDDAPESTAVWYGIPRFWPHVVRRLEVETQPRKAYGPFEVKNGKDYSCRVGGILSLVITIGGLLSMFMTGEGRL